MQAYALKAAREGKQETSWLNPRRGLRGGPADFHRADSGSLDLGRIRQFAGNSGAARRLLGALNSLSQITLKATMPGVPDFYQGTEFWDLSLVDPDNRRPVDFAERAAVLASMETPDWEDLVRTWPDGHIKLAWTRHLLKLRTEFADVFTHGDYEPMRGQRPAPRPCHRLCAAPWPRRRDHVARHEIIRADCRKAAGRGPRADAL